MLWTFYFEVTIPTYNKIGVGIKFRFMEIEQITTISNVSGVHLGTVLDWPAGNRCSTNARRSLHKSYRLIYYRLP